jgi:hypothetical protein
MLFNVTIRAYQRTFVLLLCKLYVENNVGLLVIERSVLHANVALSLFAADYDAACIVWAVM